jgi:hypothetical protein
VNLQEFENGSTVQFTWTSSVAPNSAPVFAVRDGRTDTFIHSAAAVQSSSTAYYALFTMPGSDGYFTGEFTAQKTFSGSAYDFVRRFGFKARQTIPET